MSVPVELSVPARILTPYNNLPSAAVMAIHGLISSDEGDELETDLNDNDGGWTYYGMTSKLFTAYFPKVTLDLIKQWIAEPDAKDALVDAVCSVYYQEFYLPLSHYEDTPQPAHLSCAINCGEYTAVSLINSVGLDTLNNRTRRFCSLWKDYYFAILKNNPSDIKYIHGWINRVWKYLPTGS